MVQRYSRKALRMQNDDSNYRVDRIGEVITRGEESLGNIDTALCSLKEGSPMVATPAGIF